MSDYNAEAEAEDINDFTAEESIDPQCSVELTEEWITWLAQADLPSGVEGVDSSKDDLGGAEAYA